MKKVLFNKAKRKFIEYRVYSFTISKRGLFGSDEYKLRYDMRGSYDYYCGHKDWYYDIKNQNGFVDRFLYAKELGKRDGFYFTYQLKSDVLAITPNEVQK